MARKLGADPVSYGNLQTAFGIAQLVGGPIFGRIGDLFGAKVTLILAFASSALSYGLTGIASNLPLLFLAKIPCIFMHVMQSSQMIATKLSSTEGRSAALSRLGFSYGLGMMVGPSLGGYISTNFEYKKNIPFFITIVCK